MSGILKRKSGASSRWRLFWGPFALTGLLLGAIYWIVDTIIMSYMLDMGEFTLWIYQSADPDELYMRIFSVFLLVALGLVSQYYTSAQKLESLVFESFVKRYRDLFEHANDGIIIANPQNRRFLDVNQWVIDKYGYSRKELLAMRIEDIASARSIDQIQEVMEKLSRGETNRMQTLHRRKDGSFFPVELSSRATPWGEGTAVQTIVHDITERKKTEAHLQRLSTAIENTADGILITDATASIQYLNPALEKITGYDRKSLIGKSPSLLRGDRHSDAFYDSLWETILNGEEWKGRFINRRADGTHYYAETAISPISAANGQVTNFVAVQRDVTLQKTMEDQLRQAEMLATIGQFAQGIAHEIKNPLFAISSGLQMMSMDADVEKEDKETLQLLYSETMRINRLIERLVSYTRSEKLHREPIVLKELIQEAIKVHSGMLKEKNIEVDINLSQEMPTIYANRDKMMQVLTNLIQNAIYASFAGGRIGFEGKPLLPKGDRISLTLRDQGKGVSKEHKEQIFDIFFSATKGGSGLGLAICKSIVIEHGGSIRFHPGPNGGAVFILELPVGHPSREIEG